jgi:AAA15 family ATPase/GTPase
LDAAQVSCDHRQVTTSEADRQASMLLAFRTANVRSFRDEVTVSMLATAMAEGGAVRHIGWREGGRPVGVLPVAGVFGANASGKSNLLQAMSDMRGYVLHSFRSGSPTGGIPRRPFLLDAESRQAPSRFEIDLVLRGVRHEYGFALDDDVVSEEWAFHYPNGRAALLFRRTGNVVNLGPAARDKGRAAIELLRSNALFLSTAAAANQPSLLQIYAWFERNLMLAQSDSRPFRQALTAQLLDDQRSREQVMALLRAADLGISGAKRYEIDAKTKDRVHRAVQILLGKEGEPGGDDEGDGKGLNIERLNVRLTHQGASGDVELDPTDESLGTLVWFGLVGPVIQALSGGAVLLVDELDASLHPALVAALVTLFQGAETNPTRAQLIFNSHDATLLGDSVSDPLIGRDQIWFTEKRNDGSSRLYPLSDLDPRKEEAIGKRYLAGRYGATPVLSRERFATIAESLTTGNSE